MPTLAPKEYLSLLGSDLVSFIQRSFHEINPSTRFLQNWHIELIAGALEKCRTGKTRRLIINLPPRHLKSLCASVAYPAWLLGHDPTSQVLCVSYGQDLAEKHARDCRAIMASNWYRGVFGTRLSPQKQAIQEFVTTAQGFRLSTSVGGVLTGRGADTIIIDDPLKPEEAISDSRRTAANEWYDGTLYSRLNDKEKGCIIVIMQRLHQDDLVGHVLQQEGWEVLSFPAIAQQEETFVIESTMGRRTFRRQPGDVLHPERESLEILQQIRENVGEYHFAGQYLQMPAPAGGGMVKERWFKRYRPQDLPQKFESILQSWDTANKATELSNYSVCTTWGMIGSNLYLLDVVRKRLTYPDLKRAVCQQATTYKADVVLIEDKASGTQLIQELAEEGMAAVTRFEPSGDKVMRMHVQTGMIENGLVHIPDEAHWLAEYLAELTTFPNGRYDDQVDSTAQALSWTKVRPASWGLLRYAQQQIEAARITNAKKTVRVRPTSVTSHIITISGREIPCRSDGDFDVNEDEAWPFLANGFTRVDSPRGPETQHLIVDS